MSPYKMSDDLHAQFLETMFDKLYLLFWNMVSMTEMLYFYRFANKCLMYLPFPVKMKIVYLTNYSVELLIEY